MLKPQDSELGHFTRNYRKEGREYGQIPVGDCAGDAGVYGSFSDYSHFLGK